ncbi:hypothetical protein [Streptomyces sp. AHA2]|uniref:hypothetical protein n=1 Tax=Streptomyces sp. AHA2 TaxID=3064526 RepID=UPI002FE0C29A
MKRTYATSCLALLTVSLTATPAAAGGILPIGSPAFGTSCANHHTGAHANGATTSGTGTGTGTGNLAGLPLGSPFNQCGGADFIKSTVKSTDFLNDSTIGISSPKALGLS